MEASCSNLSYIAVMPEQFFSVPHCSDTGEAALMYAVLEDALHCFAKQFVETGIRAQFLGKEAERWFFSNNESWPFSFVNICFVLGMNPEYVRLGLRQWRQHRPTQGQPKKRHRASRPRSLQVAA